MKNVYSSLKNAVINGTQNLFAKITKIYKHPINLHQVRLPLVCTAALTFIKNYHTAFAICHSFNSSMLFSAIWTVVSTALKLIERSEPIKSKFRDKYTPNNDKRIIVIGHPSAKEVIISSLKVAAEVGIMSVLLH